MEWKMRDGNRVEEKTMDKIKRSGKSKGKEGKEDVGL